MNRAKITAIILAAGFSRRAAPANKLLLPSGRAMIPVVRATVEAFLGADLDETLVVTGFDRERVEASLQGKDVRFVFADDYAYGMGNSLAAGIRASARDAVGFAICPGDLPELTPGLVGRVIDEFAREGGKKHVIPTASGQRGHPVVISAALRGQLERLDGDQGARRLLASFPQDCLFVEVADGAILRDVDTPASAWPLEE